MTKTLYVRFSTAADLDRIVRFYNDHQTPYVFPRATEVWKERAAAGAVTLVEDEAGNIVASTISYPIIAKDEHGEDIHRWTEIGSVRVGLEGIGLFTPLISAQIMRAQLLEQPKDRFVLEIVVTNERSIHVFEKIGGKPFTVPEDLFKAVQTTFTPEALDRKVTWFSIGPEDIPAIAANIMGSIGNPVLKDKRTGAEYRIDFSRTVLQSVFLDDIRTLASERTPRPALKKGIRLAM